MSDPSTPETCAIANRVLPAPNKTFLGGLLHTVTMITVIYDLFQASVTCPGNDDRGR